jgi:hypothetical protein
MMNVPWKCPLKMFPEWWVRKYAEASTLYTVGVDEGLVHIVRRFKARWGCGILFVFQH